jgi:hypothetical protein
VNGWHAYDPYADEHDTRQYGYETYWANGFMVKARRTDGLDD